MRILPALLLLLPFFAAPGCGGTEDDGRLRVVVSVVPHAWLVREVAGDRVDVTALVGKGDSPATYQPTDAQVSDVMRAKVWFRTGVPFEDGSWHEALDEAPAIRVVDLREGLDLREMVAHHHDEGHDHAGHDCSAHGDGTDPHVWLSSEGLVLQAATVCRALSELDPANAVAYEAGRASVQAAVEAATADAHELLEPHAGGSIYVFHPAWGYFCDDHDLEQVPIELEGKEPSESELTELVKQARQDDVKVLFVQAQIVGRAAEAVAKAVGAEVRHLDPLAADVPANMRAVAEAFAAALR